MMIGISSPDDNLDSQIDPRFGRSQFFLLVDTDTMGSEVIDNRNITLGCNPGVQAARQIIAKEIKAVITGKCGPIAVQVFSNASIDVYTGQAGTINSVITTPAMANLRWLQKPTWFCLLE